MSSKSQDESLAAKLSNCAGCKHCGACQNQCGQFSMSAMSAAKGNTRRRLVRMYVELTPKEHERLMALLGMAANDPGDDDHAVLESLRRKCAESKPNTKDH